MARKIKDYDPNQPETKYNHADGMWCYIMDKHCDQSASPRRCWECFKMHDLFQKCETCIWGCKGIPVNMGNGLQCCDYYVNNGIEYVITYQYVGIRQSDKKVVAWFDCYPKIYEADPCFWVEEF